ncbi:MAG: hypothetical protein WDK95_13190, partial [Syntrophorhabdaceae bacterium]
MIPKFFDKTGILLNILIAYVYLKGNSFKLTDTYRRMINLLYLDSGAYSVYKGASNIGSYGYRRYLTRYGDKFDSCFNLDDRFDNPDHNFVNQIYLEDNPSTVPVPVVHDNIDPFREFEIYVAQGHTFVAIGSAGSSALKDRLLTQAKEKYPDVKIHLFGDLDRKLLEKHRPYSADSASWAHQAGMGGGIYYWRPSENKSYRYNIGARESVKGSQHIKLSPFWEEIQEFLYEKFRYEYNDLQNYEVR